jgi:hypothetical protein
MGGGFMKSIGNRGKIIICTFLFAVILCGAVSAAATVNFSSDGKNITITPNNVPSTLKTSVGVVVKNGVYGYGQYILLKVTGQDNKGINTSTTINYYNGVMETMIDKFTSVDGLATGNENTVLGKNQYNMKVNSKVGNITFSGSGYIPIYTVNGQKVINNGVVNVNYYLNGTLYGTSKIDTLFGYKLFNGKYQAVKMTDTTTIVYANGNTRTSVVTSVYNRNSQGTETGMVTTGTSRGIEKINNNNVSYTGKITISTRHDPKDVLNEGYNSGTYKEVRTSSSPVLIKEIPLDAL